MNCVLVTAVIFSVFYSWVCVMLFIVCLVGICFVWYCCLDFCWRCLLVSRRVGLICWFAVVCGLFVYLRWLVCLLLVCIVTWCLCCYYLLLLLLLICYWFACLVLCLLIVLFDIWFSFVDNDLSFAEFVFICMCLFVVCGFWLITWLLMFEYNLDFVCLV